MADTQATGASTTVDDSLPAGITRKQDEIIQYVAKHVVASCDGARYQDKVRTRTRHNPYFDFLQAKHPYHTYYQYLLESYRHWMLNSAAVGTGAWGVALGDGQGQDAYGEQQQQQQQWSEEDYYQYYGNYAGQAGGLGDGGMVTDSGFGNGSATAAAPHDASQQQVSTQQPANGAVSSAAWAPETGYDPSAVGAEPPVVAAAEPEDADDEEYELVMEDGQWVSRKRT